MSKKDSKVKSKKLLNDDRDEENIPYYHPELEKQILIRFPPNIAQSISNVIRRKDDSNNIFPFHIKFRDSHHADITIMDQNLMGVLGRLPTFVETHRTLDGHHLFKSADIGEMLYVHYPDEIISKKIGNDYVFKSGVTPPTTDIVENRRERHEGARNRYDPSNLIDGIEYWEMVETQINHLISKDHTSKTVTRHEFFKEPEEAPEILERALRKKYGDKYKGYSGKEYDMSQLEKINISDEPIIKLSDKHVSYIRGEDFEEMDDGDFLDNEPISGVTNSRSKEVKKQEEEERQEENDEEEEDEEEDDEEEDEEPSHENELKRIDKELKRLESMERTSGTQSKIERLKERKRLLEEKMKK